MIEELGDPIYVRSTGIEPGTFAWCPVGNLEEVPRVLDVDRASPTDHVATRFRVVQVGEQHFREREKLPIHALKLGPTEEILVSKAKKRPCVVLSCSNTEFKDPRVLEEVRKKRHLQDGAITAAPIFSVATADSPSGFEPVMTARIRALMYNQFFYLPAECPNGGPAPVRVPSIARLDRIFSTHLLRGCEPMNIGLAPTALGLLLEMTRIRFGGKPSEEFLAVQELFIGVLPDEAKVAAPA